MHGLGEHFSIIAFERYLFFQQTFKNASTQNLAFLNNFRFIKWYLNLI